MVERGGRGPPRRPPRALGALALDAPLVPRRGHLELGRHAPLRVLHGLFAGAPGILEQRLPRPVAEVVAQARADEALGGRAPRRPRAERERERLLAVAE